MQREALDQLITEYGDLLYGFCCRLCGGRAGADDLYQDTFLKAVELCHKLDGSGNPKSYLMGIALRLWKNRRKQYAQRTRILPPAAWEEAERTAADESAEPERCLLAEERARLVRQAVTETPPRIRQLLYLYYTAELSVPEIAELLRLPEGTVKSRLHRGRKLVKAYLEANDDEDG